MNNNKYTPATIDKTDKSFIIPLYQRLFEWEEAQVLQLLNDLYSSFQKEPENPYYIGMLTAFKGDGDTQYSLVDGQQRFTVLTLLGIVLGWKDFLKVNGNLRLSFFARKSDEAYLKSLIDQEKSEYKNRKIKAGIECIQKFMEGKEERFKEYVQTQTTFFISELPKTYTLQDLNRYFETMNEAGKGLENHEILKVTLLKLLGKATLENYGDYYTRIWNEVSEMDKCIIKQKENETQADYKKNNFDIFNDVNSEKAPVKRGEGNTVGSFKSLIDIEQKNEKPSEVLMQRSEKAILSFTDFLLQVLWLCLKKEERHNATDFFNRNKLLETFEANIKDEKEGKGGTVAVGYFFEHLLIYRYLFDYYIVRLNSSDERNVTYALNQVIDESNNESKRSLIQYQSMLYVSTETHLWLTPFLEKLADKEVLTTDSALAFLKNWDNEQRVANTDISFNYGSVNRYWFWRLDYYLWLNRDECFAEKEAKAIADKYIFRSNRSIEHVAPQTPKSNSDVKVEEDLLHTFGNLAMISAGQNSSLQNESFEVKQAHVKSFINGSVGGSIQSLKMLDIYRYDSWEEADIKRHHDKMIKILIDSFESEDSKYSTFIKHLKAQKINLAS